MALKKLYELHIPLSFLRSQLRQYIWNVLTYRRSWRQPVFRDRFHSTRFQIIRLLNFPHTCYRSSAMKTANLEMWKKEHSFAFHGLPCSKTYCCFHLFHLRCCHQTAPYVRVECRQRIVMFLKRYAVAWRWNSSLKPHVTKTMLELIRRADLISSIFWGRFVSYSLPL